MAPLVVFGGKDEETGLVINQDESAFEVGFSCEICRKAWAKVGAAPYTRACLTDKKVRRELGDADDGMNALMISLQEGNITVCALLKTMGYCANHLQVQVKQVRTEKKKVTASHLLERQHLLSQAKSHGEKFTVTGGSHLTHDDMFVAMEIPVKNKQIAAAEKDKAYRVSMEKIEKEALAIQAGPKDPKDYLVQELDVLLKWHQVPMKDVPGKQKKIAKWSEIMGSTKPPPISEVDGR